MSETGTDELLCPVCKTSLDTRPAPRPQVRYCPTCGLGYTWPVGKPAPPLSPPPIHRVPHLVTRVRQSTKRGFVHALGKRGFPFLRVIPPPGRTGAQARALDLGCGSGFYVRALLDVGWRAWGMDIERHVLRRAAHFIPEHVCMADGGALPLADGSVGLVTLWHVLEHLPAPHLALDDVRRIVQPGGYVLIEVPNAGALQARVAGHRWLHWDLPRHRWHFTADTLRRLLVSEGFTSIRVWTWPNAPGWVDTWGFPRHWRWLFWLVDVPPALLGYGGVLRALARVP